MKKLPVRRGAAVLAAVVLACAAPAVRSGASGVGERVRPSGRTVTREFGERGFDRVQVGSAFEAEIRRGPSWSVEVEIDEALLPYLQVRESGGTLSVGLRPVVGFDGRGSRPMLRLVMPGLAGLELSGAAQAGLQGFRSDRPLEVELSGASGLRGEVGTGPLRVSASGASRVSLAGSGGNARLEASGASELDLSGFRAGDVEVELSGASTATVNAAGRLDVRASGASRLRFLGQPRMGRVDLSGASTIDSR